MRECIWESAGFDSFLDMGSCFLDKKCQQENPQGLTFLPKAHNGIPSAPSHLCCSWCWVSDPVLCRQDGAQVMWYILKAMV